MIRRIALAGVTAALALGAIAATAGPAAAVKPPPFNATGTVNCNIVTGSVKIAPGLTFTPTVQSTTIKIKLACSGSTGNPAVTVTGGKATGALTNPNPSTCASLVGEGMNPVTLHVAWKASGGKINPSDITYTTYNGSPTTFAVPGPSGTSSITGSFAGEHSQGQGNIGLIKGDCSAKKPVKGIKFAGGSTVVHPAGP